MMRQVVLARRLGTAAAGSATALLFVLHARWIGFFGDDAYISFQYARNLLRGNGLVYNVGERVEGYSNFLWVMLLSGLSAVFGSANMAVLATVVGLVFGVLTMGLLVVTARRLHPERRGLCLLAPLLMASHTPYCAWSTGGLEGPLFAFLVLLGIYLQDRELRQQRGSVQTAAVAVLIALTRADGFVVVAILAAWRLAEWYWRRRSQGVTDHLRWGAVFLCGFGAHLLWRHWYYGEWLPNTSVAKVGLTIEQILRGVSFTRRFWTEAGGAVLLIALTLPWIRRLRQPALRGALSVTLGWTAYVVFVGGDGLAFFRFYTFVAPLICLLAQEGILSLLDFIDSAAPAISRVRATAAVAAATAVLVLSSARLSIDLYRHPNPKAAPYRNGDNYFLAKCRVAGEWLAAHTPPDAVVASTPAGAVAYFSDRHVIDMLGLNDYHIARAPVTGMGRGRAGHERGDGVYVLSRQPDYILMGNVTVGRDGAMTAEKMAGLLRLRSENELWALPQFHERYEMVTVETGAPDPFPYFTFYRRKGLAPF